MLGPIRLLFLVPRLGTRSAELLEMPFMMFVIVWSAQFIVRRFSVPARFPTRLAVGLIALAWLLIAEFGLVLALRGISVQDYLATRDPISGTVYYAMLVFFALMPSLRLR